MGYSMKQVWVRLGGYLTLSDEDIQRLKDGTLNVERVLERGFVVEGDSYAYDDDDLGLDSDNTEFSTIKPITMVKRA